MDVAVFALFALTGLTLPLLLFALLPALLIAAAARRTG
jgi:hypothetical protein